ncbi:MAG TPA: type II toxin-antitoxin system VapC family toxin [Patescibacteria group bacterium]|nr:type II toxin-antitoxin system VapC family toxin [Patescibacteria group bacterium]
MTDRVIIDASVAIAYLRDEVATPLVDRAARAWSRGGIGITVPAVFWTEVVNVLGAKRRYSVAQVAEALRELDELDLETVESGRPELLLVADAVERHRMSACDATYLVLAQLLDVPLATLDRRQAAAAGPLGMLLGEEGGHATRQVAARYGSPPEAERPSSLPDYAGLGAYLGELRRRAVAGTPGPARHRQVIPSRRPAG